MRIWIILIALAVISMPVFAAQDFGRCDSPLSEYRCYDKQATPYCPGSGLSYVKGWCPGGENIQCCAPAETLQGKRTGGPGLPYLGKCDIPLDGYKCYDVSEYPSCPGSGLEYVKGWCLGGNNIQCCVPPATPEGKRTFGPGITLNLPENVKVDNFQFFLEGTLSCSYKVTSIGIVTKEAKFPCDSWVTITVGPTGDCRDEGDNVCTIVNDGGLLGRERTQTFSIKFYKPAKTYGACAKYTSSSCVEESECRSTGGTPLKGYCPDQPKEIRCCVYQATHASEGGEFALDNTNDKAVPGISSIDNQLNLISQKYDAKIVLEILDDIPSDTEKNLLNKFNFKYKIRESGKTLGMVILYGKSKNAWRVLQFSDCELNSDTFRQIISDSSVSGKLKEKNYDEGMANFVKLLEAAIAKKSETGDICRETFKTKDCRKDCDSLLGCSAEKCANLDGCMWSANTPQDGSGSCENICPGERKSEVVVVKKSEQCGSAECNDVYLCRDGKIASGYPIKAAFSKTSPVSVSSCDDMPKSFRDGYERYKDIISSAIREKGLDKYTSTPEAIVAAIITQESGWKNELGDQGTSIGLMQINIKSHPECDAGKLRNFDAGENIKCGVRYLAEIAKTRNLGSPKTYACKGVEYTGLNAMLRYYNGWPSEGLNKCSGDPDYVESILSHYKKWVSCLGKQEAAQTSALSLPEGILEISEKVKVGQGISECNLNSNSIKGYWIGINNREKSLQCEGLHATDSSCPEVDSSRIGQLFSSVSVGTRMTVKSAGMDCSSVCSGIVEEIGKIIDSSHCKARCSQLGCGWENGKCISSTCAQNAANRYAKVIIYTTEESFS